MALLGHDHLGLAVGLLAALAPAFVALVEALVALLGAARTEWLSVHVRRDAPDSPDGRLTGLAIEFAGQLLDGTVATSDAGGWIRQHVCE